MNPEEYRLVVDGLVSRPLQYSLSELQSLPQSSIVRDFHCITGWSVTNVEWIGVPLSFILQQAKPLPTARYMTVYSFDGLYTDSYTLQQFQAADVLLALRMDGVDLPSAHGAPCRILFPALYGVARSGHLHLKCNTLTAEIRAVFLLKKLKKYSFYLINWI
ncbi:molybdopterin-dependent oxidoreductase [Effusibacillus dendaii]|nr:molybdopterin-dependent oxidoreductase [Effusibacillus dendaii]